MSTGPRILAIETSSRQGGVAVGQGDNLLSAEAFAVDRDYAGELLPAVDRLCRQAGWRADQIEQVYVSAGPGSFTGTRIGVTFAKTLALAAGARVVAVPTFAALALNVLALAEPPENLVVLMDARQGQVFAELFRLNPDKSGYESIKPGELVYLEDLLKNLLSHTAFLGESLGPHKDALVAAGGNVLASELSVPRAESVYRMGLQLAREGRFSNSDTIVPVYYRLPTPVERLQARHKQER